MCEKATCKMANYRRPPSTYRRLINLQNSSLKSVQIKSNLLKLKSVIKSHWD